MAPDPALFAGPILVGGFLSYFLYGIYITHCIRYIAQRSTIRRSLCYANVAVAITMVVETISVALIGESIWYILVKSIEDPLRRVNLPPASLWASTLAGVVAFMVQLFFAQKVYVLGRTTAAKGLALCIVMLSAVQFSAALSFPLVFGKIDQSIVIKSDNQIEKSIAVHLSFTAACDVLITGSMIFVLARFNRYTTLSSTKRILHRLTIHTIENGSITTILALLDLLFYFTRQRKDSIHMLIFYILPRVYSNVMMVSLNRSNQAQSDPTSLVELTALRTTIAKTVELTSEGDQRNPDADLEGHSLFYGAEGSSRSSTIKSFIGVDKSGGEEVKPIPSIRLRELRPEMVISVSTEVQVHGSGFGSRRGRGS